MILKIINVSIVEQHMAISQTLHRKQKLTVGDVEGDFDGLVVGLVEGDFWMSRHEIKDHKC